MIFHFEWSFNSYCYVYLALFYDSWILVQNRYFFLKKNPNNFAPTRKRKDMGFKDEDGYQKNYATSLKTGDKKRRNDNVE